jgi:hypothetical protein
MTRIIVGITDLMDYADDTDYSLIGKGLYCNKSQTTKTKKIRVIRVIHLIRDQNRCHPRNPLNP